jgi:hypothetical protein
MEPVATDRRKVVAGQPLGCALGHHVKFALELRDKVGLCRKVGFWRENPKVGFRKINNLRA